MCVCVCLWQWLWQTVCVVVAVCGFVVQCSAVPCTAVPCSNVQCSAAQCSPQCSAMRKAAVQCYSATLCNALNGSSVLCNRRRAGGGGGCHCCCCNAGGIAHVSAGERASLCVCVYAPAALPLSFASMQCRQHRHRSRPLIVRRACRAFPGGAGGGRGAQHTVSNLSLRFRNGQHTALTYITLCP